MASDVYFLDLNLSQSLLKTQILLTATPPDCLCAPFVCIGSLAKKFDIESLTVFAMMKLNNLFFPILVQDVPYQYCFRKYFKI